VNPSPFLDRSKWIAENDLAFAVLDGFPVSPGHTLVLPKRLHPSFFGLLPHEQNAMIALVNERRMYLKGTYRADRPLDYPDAFTIGINDGEAAGQTVAHAHIHIIPRYRGDVPNPRGGIRGVIPGRANY
jgi:diadenosine tetraphosphate (Ap4A) HIT family hydrolase